MVPSVLTHLRLESKGRPICTHNLRPPSASRVSSVGLSQLLAPVLIIWRTRSLPFSVYSSQEQPSKLLWPSISGPWPWALPFCIISSLAALGETRAVRKAWHGLRRSLFSKQLDTTHLPWEDQQRMQMASLHNLVDPVKSICRLSGSLFSCELSERMHREEGWGWKRGGPFFSLCSGPGLVRVGTALCMILLKLHKNSGS